ncbi:hypothetical protein [Yeosuana marina]|uniref:hypothetical protein n=1 Tax=Yeosuana marina TaxID=1565536 RepID=UPI0014237A06|nr:hypothetical protein [Yeosuana marina]
MNKANVAILTTVINFELYAITSNLFPAGIRKYAIDGRNGMHGIHSIYYIFKKLSNKDIDWLILADEDVVFNNANVVYSIINKMEEENISVCGVRDGGIISHRNYNPIVVNTFFTIINFKEISSEWNKSEVKKNQYILPNEFQVDKNIFKEPFDVKSLYEPYYCFFLWLIRKGNKFLYLEAQMLNDNISNTILYDGEPFAYHTWYARSYNVNEKHTNRMNSVLDNMNVDINSTKIDSNIKILKDPLFYYKMELLKLYKRSVNRLNGKYRNI